MNQRWRDRIHTFRPDGETIDTRRYEVAPIAEDAPVKAFVERHHYSGSYPAARERVGLYRGVELVGVAVFSIPCRAEVLTNVFPDADSSVELGRFVLLDDVPGNGESWFLARCLRALIREGYVGVVSFSDPFVYTSVAGDVTMPGHVGTIYQASNARYLGRTQRRTLRLLPDGKTFSARAWSKIRAKERGWRYAAAILERYGASAPPEILSELRAWLETWLERLTRRVRHPGQHRYAFALDKRLRLPEAHAYPKRGIA